MDGDLHVCAVFKVNGVMLLAGKPKDLLWMLERLYKAMWVIALEN